MPLAGETELSAITKDPQALLRIPVGAMSPLWGLFAGAAVSGAAWWWMTRWTRPANLEALFGAAETTVEKAAIEMKALAAPVVLAIEQAQIAAETRVEEVHDAVVQAAEAIQPVAEAAEAAVETGAAVATETLESAAEAGLETVEATATAMAQTADAAVEEMTVAANTVEEAVSPAPALAAEAVDAVALAVAPDVLTKSKAKKSKAHKAD